MKGFTSALVEHIAELAAIPITTDESQALAQAFSQTLKVIDNLAQANITGVEPTHQVTGLVNSWRDDRIDESRMFSQKQALANAHQVYKGFVVVPQVISK